MREHSTPEEMLRQIADFTSATQRVTPTDVERWLSSDDYRVLGSAYDAVSTHWERVEPRLSRQVVGELLLKILATAPAVLARGDIGFSGYDAASELMRWVHGVAHDQTTDNEAAECAVWIKNALADLYVAGDERLKRVIVDGLLEHVFENEEARRLFDHWKTVPSLQRAYTEAAEWADKR